MQLTFEFTKKGSPVIRIDSQTFFSFTNKALTGTGPWETLFLHGFYETNLKGTIIKERVSDSSYFSKLQFKNKSKSCIDKVVFTHIIKILKKFINANGQILDKDIPALQAEIEVPFEVEKTKKKTVKREYDAEGNPIKSKRGPKKKAD